MAANKRDMQKENQMLQALFNYSTEGIIICNSKGEIVLANPKSLSLFGYNDEQELLGQTIEILIPQRFQKNHKNHRKKYSNNPSPRAMGQNIELFAKRKDGSEFAVEVSLSPFVNDNEKYVVAFIIDITQRKLQQEEVKRINLELLEKNREILALNDQLESKVRERTKELAQAMQQLAESKNEVLAALEKEKRLNDLKSKFVTTASHEFRTPLGAILSSAALIAKYSNVEDQEKRLKHINRIKSSVTNLTEILNDFLSLDKLEEGIIRNQPVVFNIKEFIRDIIDEVSPILKRGQAIQYQFRDNRSEVVLDKQLLRNVLINLISNAIKYSPEDSVIMVDISVKNGKLKIDVIDRGIGIPKEDQKNLFERFFRANNAGNVQGTGLGLNIVKKYVEIMGGNVTFISEVGKGSTFTVEISF